MCFHNLSVWGLPFVFLMESPRKLIFFRFEVQFTQHSPSLGVEVSEFYHPIKIWNIAISVPTFPHALFSSGRSGSAAL